jgi:hypothetical protein
MSIFDLLAITLTRNQDNRAGRNHGRSDSHHFLGFQRKPSDLFGFAAMLIKLHRVGESRGYIHSHHHRFCMRDECFWCTVCGVDLPCDACSQSFLRWFGEG